MKKESGQSIEGSEGSSQYEMMSTINQTLERPKGIESLPLDKIEPIRASVLELPEYQNYQKEKIRLEVLDSLLEDFDRQAKDAGAVKNTRNVLEGMINGVHSEVDRYYSSVMRVEHLKLKKFRIEPDEYKEELVERDRSRRVVHNALLSALTALTRYCNNVIPSKHEITFPSEKFFTSEQLGDRTYVGDWAFTMEVGRRVNDVLEIIDHALEQKGAGMA